MDDLVYESLLFGRQVSQRECLHRHSSERRTRVQLECRVCPGKSLSLGAHGGVTGVTIRPKIPESERFRFKSLGAMERYSRHSEAGRVVAQLRGQIAI